MTSACRLPRARGDRPGSAAVPVAPHPTVRYEAATGCPSRAREIRRAGRGPPRAARETRAALSPESRLRTRAWRQLVARPVLVVPFALAASGCGGGLEPRDVTGSYVVTAANGAGLPHLAESTADCDRFVARGELLLEPTSRYQLELAGPFDCRRSGGTLGTAGSFYVGTYAAAGRRLSFAAPVVGGDTLRFGGEAVEDRIELTVPPIPPQQGPDLTLRLERRR
jgi:hypothetical protein